MDAITKFTYNQNTTELRCTFPISPLSFSHLLSDAFIMASLPVFVTVAGLRTSRECRVVTRPPLVLSDALVMVAVPVTTAESSRPKRRRLLMTRPLLLKKRSLLVLNVVMEILFPNKCLDVLVSI